MRKIYLLTLLTVLVLAADASGDVPQTISYQGVLKDDTGAIVPDGDYTFRFRIYNVASGGTALWTEDQTKHVTAGILNVILGEEVKISLPFDEEYWLGVAISGGFEAVPRTRLTGTPYSLNAQAVRGENIFPQGGDVGIGTAGPSYPLHIVTDEIVGLRIDGSASGSWSSLAINASGVASWPAVQYFKGDAYKASTFVGAGDDWHLKLGTTKVITAEATTNDIGINNEAPEEKLDVNGAVRIGTTVNLNAGTIRWTGSDFEGYDGGTWLSLTSNGGSSGLPAGSTGQTLRHNGLNWIVSDLLYNNGTNVGIGTTSPGARLDVAGDNISSHFRLTAPTGVGPALYLNAVNKDWVIYGTNPDASAGDSKFVIRDFTSATDRLTIDENGYVGISENRPDAPLHIPGGHYDLDNTEGDLKIGDDDYRLKIGVDVSGGGDSGYAAIRVQGGNERLVLGAGNAEALWIENDGTVSIGAAYHQTGAFDIYRNAVPDPMISMMTSMHGGNLWLTDEKGYHHVVFSSDYDGTGANFRVLRNETDTGFSADGNFNGTEEPRVYVSGSTNYFAFNADLTGDSSVILPNSCINSTELANESGGASNNTNDSSAPGLPPGINVITSQTITVPDAGLVLVIASSSVDVLHTNGTTSSADFGVSDNATSFPVCQDVNLMISANQEWGVFRFPVTVHSLFDVTGSGSYTYYFLGEQHGGDFHPFEVQLSLIYLPTEYGTVASTAPGINTAEEKSSLPSPADIESTRRESIDHNTARIERELAELRTQVEDMKRQMEAERQK